MASDRPVPPSSPELTRVQVFFYLWCPNWIYRKSCSARLNRGYRLIEIDHLLEPTWFGWLLRFTGRQGRFEGSGREWNFIHSGEPLDDQPMIDFFEQVWLHIMGIEHTPDLITTESEKSY